MLRSDPFVFCPFVFFIDNRLVQLVTPNSQLVTYYYDPFGRRLWKEVAGTKTYFFYSDEGLIGEYNATGLEIKTYGYAPNSTWTTNPLFQRIGPNYYWYQNDHLGTPQKMTDSTGRVVWSATYDSFGKAQIQISEIENNLRFPGQYCDQETGLHYNYFRYYNPQTGRYITPDPIGLAGGINLFAYVAGNPINRIDPFGLLSCTYSISGRLLHCINNAGQSFYSPQASSGRGSCQDNPQCTSISNEGPLPTGVYTIHLPGYVAAHPGWLYLEPRPSNNMYGRFGFFAHPWGTSKGCIMLHTSDFNTLSDWVTRDNGGAIDVIF